MADPAQEAKEAVGTAIETAKSAAETATETAKLTAETAKSTAAGLSETVSETVEKGVEGLLSRGLAGATSLLHNVEEKKGDISSKLAEAASNLTHYSGSADSAPPPTVDQSTRDLPQSTENQPLVASGERSVQTTPWWQSCCGVLDVLKGSGR